MHMQDTRAVAAVVSSYPLSAWKSIGRPGTLNDGYRLTNQICLFYASNRLMYPDAMQSMVKCKYKLSMYDDTSCDLRNENRVMSISVENMPLISKH